MQSFDAALTKEVMDSRMNSFARNVIVENAAEIQWSLVGT